MRNCFAQMQSIAALHFPLTTMRETRLPWDDLRLLLEVHRCGSFFAAANALGLSTSTVARRIDALERTIGHAVVHRTSQGVWLENDALELIGAAERFEHALGALRRDDSPHAGAYAGVVRVSVPDGFGSAMAIAAARLQRQHPETQVEIVAEARFVDLSAREADIGIRGGRSSSRILLEKSLGEIQGALFATRDYLARRLPSRVLAHADYASQDFIAKDAISTGRGSPPHWLVQRGATRFPLRSNAFDARLQAGLEGLGIVELAAGSAATYPTLQRIALEDPIAPVRFFLTMHRDLRKVPRVRAFAAEVQQVFAEYLALQHAEEARFYAALQNKLRATK